MCVRQDVKKSKIWFHFALENCVLCFESWTEAI